MLAFVCALPTMAQAQDRRIDLETAVTACTAITSMVERLRCFDQLGRDVRKARTDPPGATPAPANAAGSMGTGKWKQTVTNGADGKPVLLRVELAAEDDIRGPGRQAARPMLLMSCSEQGTGLWLADIFTAGADTLVTLQIDSAKPAQQRWANASDGRNMGLWSNAEDTALRLTEGNRLKISYPADGRTATIWFDLRGTAQAVKPLRDYCHW